MCIESIVTYTVYAAVSLLTSGEASEEIANVTVSLQNQVRDSSLRIPADVSKVSILISTTNQSSVQL